MDKKFIVHITGETPEALAESLKQAAAALEAGQMGCPDEAADKFFIEELLPPQYAPNTLYVQGTDANGKLVISGMRSTSDAAKDHHIMDSALEFSQAYELRNVVFPERKLGGILIRPAVETV